MKVRLDTPRGVSSILCTYNCRPLEPRRCRGHDQASGRPVLLSGGTRWPLAPVNSDFILHSYHKSARPARRTPLPRWHGSPQPFPPCRSLRGLRKNRFSWEPCFSSPRSLSLVEAALARRMPVQAASNAFASSRVSPTFPSRERPSGMGVSYRLNLIFPFPGIDFLLTSSPR